MPPELKKLTKSMPKPSQVLETVVENLGYNAKDALFFEHNFADCLQGMMDEGQKVLRGHQKVAIKEIIRLSDSFEQTEPLRSDALMWKGFTSLSNQSRKRAGVHMELSVRWILNKLNVPNALGKPVTGRSDLVCPDIETFDSHPERCVVLEFKRTLRERWKEVIDEISKSGRNVFLLTLDDYISDALVESMHKGNVTMYVPDAVYGKLKKKPGRLRALGNFVTDLTHLVPPNPQTKLTQQ